MQVRLLKLNTDGLPEEFGDSDEITLTSFTVFGGGPVLSSTGLDANNTDITDVNDLTFNDPTTGTINQTAGNLIIDNIVGKDRENVFTTSGSVTFPVITDSAGQVDSFRLPALAGTPSATPTNGGEGHLVWDSTNNKLYAWNGSSWDDMSTADSANYLDDTYVADEALSQNDVVYISAANNVSKSSASSDATAKALGFATAAAADTANANIRKAGTVSNFAGLTPGARYYLSTTAGAITATRPTGTGNNIVQVGFARSTTQLDIQIQYLGKLA